MVYGSDRNFPGFFTPKTKYLAPANFTNLEEIAQILGKTTSQLLLCKPHDISAVTDVVNPQQGTLIACPLPEKYSAVGNEIESVIQAAVKECQ